jgi:hypothetical protein
LAAVDLAVHNGTNHIYNQKHAHIAARVAEVAHKATAQKHNKVPARKSRGDRERKQKLICLTEDKTGRKGVGDRHVRGPHRRTSCTSAASSRDSSLWSAAPSVEEDATGGAEKRVRILCTYELRRCARLMPRRCAIAAAGLPSATSSSSSVHVGALVDGPPPWRAWRLLGRRRGGDEGSGLGESGGLGTACAGWGVIPRSRFSTALRR